MLPAQGVRPKHKRAGADGRFIVNESGQLNGERVRKLLGETCALDNTQIATLTEGINALADLAVRAFVEQRERVKIDASELPSKSVEEPMLAAA
ncbi:MAG TPA: hypothetical protein VJR04_06920 [Terriglobales bacterium]|nr:hypothetical protein [Terriglobales bacterium]